MIDSITPRLGIDGISSRYHPLFQRVYDDERKPDNPHVVEALKRYDPALFVRYNRLDERWELWRYRSHVIPKKVPGLLEISKRACKLWALVEIDGSHREGDWRMLKQIVERDTFVNISSDPEKVADHMDRVERDQKEAEQKENEDWATDWAQDNKNQLRRFIGRHSLYSTPR